MSKLGFYTNGKQQKPDVDVVCMELPGNRSQKPVREAVGHKPVPDLHILQTTWIKASSSKMDTKEPNLLEL